MNKKKVLIITYYWPPSGGAGVQRWLKFTKYLGNFNWLPIIYTVKNGEFPVIDLELEKEVPDNIEVNLKPSTITLLALIFNTTSVLAAPCKVVSFETF